MIPQKEPVGMPLKVFVLSRNSHLPLGDLRRQVPADVEILDGDEVPAQADFDMLVTGFPTRAQVEASPNLRAVVAPFAGAPKEAIELLRGYPHISLHSIHFNVVPTAELAIGLMLAAAKFIVPMDRELRRSDWRSRYGKTPTTILDGRVVTILGYGRIGRRIGTVCQALGMRVAGVRRHAEGVTEDGIATVYPPRALHDLLPTSDVLMVALPLTEETEGLIGATELGLLPSEAIVVNVGRGRVIEEAALYDALHSQRILAAGLDVWYHYPLRDEERANTAPSRFPFHELDNVVMSPHRGGWLSAAESSRVTELAALITAAAQGRPIPSEVDKELGY
jgi:phosphoglycerate dehydrogenase-like enzyme